MLCMGTDQKGTFPPQRYHKGCGPGVNTVLGLLLGVREYSSSALAGKRGRYRLMHVCINRHRLYEAWSQRYGKRGRSVQGADFRNTQRCGPESFFHSPHMHRTLTINGLYSLICLLAVPPTATEPKCSTFWKPSTSWSSGRLCFMLTNSWARLAGAEIGAYWGETHQGPCGPTLNSPSKKVGVPRDTLICDTKEGKEKAKPARLGGGKEAGGGPRGARPGRKVG